MKRFIIILTFILSLSASVFAADVGVQINGEIVNFKDEQGNVVNAQIINNRTMVPMRKIFEILGVTIEWDGENRVVTGVKDDVSIKLQIDNNIATKTVSGKETEIVLDTPPTIVNNRTMVPLRFVAESLDKQVGWDALSRTAIIIDYGYFSNKVKTNAPALYNFLNTEKDYVEFNLKHNYYDLADISKNTTSNMKMNASFDENTQNIALTISGTDELSKEIMNEGWNSTAFKVTYNSDNILLESENLKLREMLKFSKAGLNKTYNELGIYGYTTGSVDDVFEIWAGISDEKLTLNTFAELKKDFDALCNLFKTTNTNGTQLTSTSSVIRYGTYNLEYFDLAKLDNFICSNEHLKMYNLINSIFFKYDVQKDIALYDNDTININFTVNNDILTITCVTNNSYNEKNEYILELKHM